MAKVNVTIAIADDHLENLPRISRTLIARGLTNFKSLQELGIITGTVEAADVAKLQDVTGVSRVEAQREVGIEPPDSAVQ